MFGFPASGIEASLETVVAVAAFLLILGLCIIIAASASIPRLVMAWQTGFMNDLSHIHLSTFGYDFVCTNCFAFASSKYVSIFLFFLSFLSFFSPPSPPPPNSIERMTELFIYSPSKLPFPSIR